MSIFLWTSMKLIVTRSYTIFFLLVLSAVHIIAMMTIYMMLIVPNWMTVSSISAYSAMIILCGGVIRTTTLTFVTRQKVHLINVHWRWSIVRSISTTISVRSIPRFGMRVSLGTSRWMRAVKVQRNCNIYVQCCTATVMSFFPRTTCKS